MKKSIRKGFTLVELVVVVLILGILSGVATLAYVDVTRAYREGVAKSNLQVLWSASQVYRMEHSGLFPQKIFSDSGLNNGIDIYLDDEFIEVLKDQDEPYKYLLRIVAGNLIISVTGPNSFSEEIVVAK